MYYYLAMETFLSLSIMLTERADLPGDGVKRVYHHGGRDECDTGLLL